jgi:hypothetical protein
MNQLHLSLLSSPEWKQYLESDPQGGSLYANRSSIHLRP